MKNLLFLSIIASSFFVGCNSPNNKYATTTTDSVINHIKAREQVEKMMKDNYKTIFTDTSGDGESPVRILVSKFVKQEYSNYKSVYLKYKNVSDKTINAIRFKWYGENSFGEPADMTGSAIDGMSGGFTDEKLKPNSISSGRWDIFSSDGKKILRVWVTEVAFSDGTKWEHK